MTYSEEHFSKIILKSGHRPRRCCLKVFLFLSGHFVQQNHFSNFGKGVLEEHFCEIIL